MCHFGPPLVTHLKTLRSVCWLVEILLVQFTKLISYIERMMISFKMRSVKYIKGTVSDMKNLQNTLEIKKNTFPSQPVPFFLKKIA